MLRAPGAWKHAGRFKLGSIRTWKQAIFNVADPHFAHRQNRRDIRDQVQGDKELTFGGPTIQAREPE